jgi:peptidoglycan hydrolase-like protein with peptidoglycan-binding domain
LRLVGEPAGPIDGRFGPLTEGAVTRFQRRQGLAVDGLVGPQTEGALRAAARLLAAGAGYGAPDGSARVRALQRSLRVVGERVGPVDGRFGPLTTAAVIRFQRRQGLAADGLAGEATIGALTRATRLAGNRVPSLRRTGRPRPAGGVHRAPAVETSPAADSQGSGSAISRAATLALVAGLALAAGAALMLAGARRTRRVHRERGAARLGEQLTPDSPLVLGYASVPGAASGPHRDELRDQLQAIVAECRRRRLMLVDVVREQAPDDCNGLKQPGLGHALRRIEQGEANGLVVAELSRISRSVTDLGEVLEWFSRSGARLVAAGPGLDTGEQGGRAAVSALIDLSSRERERAREALEADRRGESGDNGG